MKVEFRGWYDTDDGNMVVDIGEDWEGIWPDLPKGFNFYVWEIDGMSYLRFGRGGQKSPIKAAGISRTK